MIINLFFFFQAEDGIRDLYVTGVQTCALPISGPVIEARSARVITEEAKAKAKDDRLIRYGGVDFDPRSEERRVGKECRYRRRPDHKKKNDNITNIEHK